MHVTGSFVRDVLSHVELKAIESGSYAEVSQEKIARRLNQLYDTITLYLPRFVIQSDRSTLQAGEEIYGAVLMADISGFTAFSETLKQMGKKGSEELTRIVNSYFSPFLSIIFKYGGDLINFSGDALNVIFTEGKDQRKKEERALAAAWSLHEIIHDFSEIQTSQGVFRLGLHIGLHVGRVTALELGKTAIGLKLGMFGKVFNATYGITTEAQHGEILLSDAFFKRVKDHVVLKTKKKNKNLLDRVKSLSPHTDYSPPLKSMTIMQLIEKIEYLSCYLNRSVLEKIKADPSFDGVIGEHRRSSVIFLNLTGLDDEWGKDALHDLECLFADIQDIVALYDGTINKLDFCSSGTRLMIVFGAPFSHEDDETRAAACALQIRAAGEEHGLTSHIGINSGYIFAGDVGSQRRREYTVMGDEVNLAARLMANARENEIVISESIRSAIRDGYELTILRKVRIKGKKEPLNISCLLKALPKAELKKKWFGATESVVGRTKERQQIDDIIRSLPKSRGMVLSITGEAGIGKSRLCREVYRRAAEHSFMIFLGNCESFGREMSYLPFSTILGQYFDFHRDDGKEKRREKLVSRLELIDKKLVEWAPIIGEHVGVSMDETTLTRSLDAKLRQQRFFDLVLDLFSEEARTQPVLVVVEDLHWVDSASLLLINYLARNIKSIPLLLCLVYRAFEKEEAFLEYDNHIELHLAEFNSAETAEFTKSLLDIEKAPEDMLTMIVLKSHGNPLYIEEMVKMLIEKGVISASDNTLVVSPELSTVEIPDRLDSLIMSRIDRLGEETKNVLQYAAVIGKEFGKDIIGGIYPRPTVLDSSFNELTTQDFIIPKKEKYEFKHILTQEVAYNSLAFETRKQLHRKAGSYIEEKEQENIEASYAILAHHFYKGEDWERAFYYSLSAGDRAKKSYANYEALAHYDRALDILDSLDQAGLLPGLMKKVRQELTRRQK